MQPRVEDEPEEFNPDHPLLELSGVGASGKHDVSENHDWYLAEIYLNEILVDDTGDPHDPD